ncbi:MAG: serine hydrolase domain-containing protein [Thermomicrobiales bacterium]
MKTTGFSSKQLQRTREILSGYVDRGEVPGMVSLVSRHGEERVETIGAKAIGGEPIQRDTLFRIASMTKPITAVAALILIEECLLRLDEPVDRWLPELANMPVLTDVTGSIDDTKPANRPITLRDLLTFRLGTGMLMGAPGQFPIADEIAKTFMAPGPPKPSRFPIPDEYMSELVRYPLMYQPGERWMYNTGSEILGVLIARVTGQSFDQFLTERIFEPLGMNDTGFTVSPEKLDRLSTSYLTNPENGGLIPFDGVENSDWRTAPAFPNGAAGLISTVDDYNDFAQMLMNGGRHGGARVLSPQSVALMTTNHLTAEQSLQAGGRDFGYGFGVSVGIARSDLGSIGRYGWSGGLGTMWFNDPAENLSVVLMTQAAWTSPVPPNVCIDLSVRAYVDMEN